MKKFIHFLSIIALIAMSASCSSDEPAPIGDNNVETDANFISVDDALISARKAFKVMLGKEKSHTRAHVDAEMFIPTSKTRNNGESLYGYYVINYGNGDGFALVSADKRRVPVLALSDEGSMHLADTTNIPGLSWYLNDNLTAMDVSGSILNPSIPIDTTLHQFDPYLNPRKTEYCEPLITGFRSRFHQQWPYNKYCPQINGKQALVGCGPLALGTIVSYYKYPDTIEGCQVKWNEMYQQIYHDSWSRLFEIMGRSQYLDASYGVDATSVYPSKYVNAVKRLGYSDGKYVEFNTYDMETQLKMKRPLFMAGYKYEADKILGHAWVADGGYEIVYRLATIDDPKHIQHDYYYHIIWGWGGTANGYFLYSSLSLGGNPHKPDDGTYGSAPKFTNLYMGIGHAPNQ